MSIRCRWRACRTCSTQRRSQSSWIGCGGPGDGAAYSVEPKVDGLSVALSIGTACSSRAPPGATAGWEDVTENLKTIRAIPMQLPEKLPRLIVRGEVYMSQAVFAEINARRELEGKPLMANPGTPPPGPCGSA